MDTVKPLVISIIRTVLMPLLAGGALSLLVFAGVDNPSAEAQAAVASLLAVGWYLAARLLETRNRYWGLMLGVATTPDYGLATKSEDLVRSVQRTVVPLVVGWAVTALAKAGLSLDTETVTLALQAGITSVYYGAIRIIEQYRPKAGVLIGGSFNSPVY